MNKYFNPQQIQITNRTVIKMIIFVYLKRVFKGSITPDDELLLKYKDEDGDLITITDK